MKAKAGKAAGKRARSRRATREGPHAGPTIVLDAAVLISLALAVFVALAVYYPAFSKPAGQVVQTALGTGVGLGMYLVPFVLLIVPLLLLRTLYRRTLLRAWAWTWCLTLLASLGGGLLRDTGWGGLLGDSAAALGYGYLGWFYPVLIVLLALIVFARLAGRTVVLPVARGAWRAAVRSGAALSDYREAVADEAQARRERRQQARADNEEREEAIRRRRAEVLAAQLEAADAPEGESPVVREPPAEGSPSGPEVELLGLGREAREPPTARDHPVDRQQPGADEFASIIEAAGQDAADAKEPFPPAAGSMLADVEAAVGEEAVADAGQLVLFPSTQAGYELPQLSLLRTAPRVREDEHLELRARVIERTLKSFNVDAQCTGSVVGPRVTRFELKIGPGINVSRIHGLSDNLALELAVKAVRIEAPIPGLSAVGIEVPNAQPQLVTLRSILDSPLSHRANHPLTVGLGRDIAGDPVVANIAKMPHVLVAGATGSGKSVCLNAMIISLLYRNAPDTLRLILIDPKRVEMTAFADLPHLACPVVHDVTQAQSALKWAVAEMDRRYRLLEAARARNIAAFNEMVPVAEQLPFVVIVVDELADLMMLAGQVIEKLVCRIAQLSRAVGIHLVIATQRPDVKVITGTIKANIPTRVAFAVVSQVDSRTILDGMGAERLLGSGDMLFSPIGENVPIRVQGAFVADDEIDRVVQWCRSQAAAHYDESITRFEFEEEERAAGEGERDELFSDALQIVQTSGRASVSYLQRRLKIGYNRAARIMEELEDADIVSEPDVQGNRKVL